MEPQPEGRVDFEMSRLLPLVLAALLCVGLVGCGSTVSSSGSDTGVADINAVDSGSTDTPATMDAAPLDTDTGIVTLDAGPDLGMPLDAPGVDVVDGGTMDGLVDAIGGDSAIDAPSDLPVDAQPSDTGMDVTTDVAPSDAGVMDASDASGCAAPRTLCGGFCTDTTSDPAHCGSCGHACMSGMVCTAGVCSTPTALPPRPMAPLSTATVTSQTPTLRWALATGANGAHIQICHDRACTLIEQTFDVVGASSRVPMALVPGVHFWQIASTIAGHVVSAWSPTWEFFVGHRSAPVDASYGTVLDFNGDGYADVIVGGDGSMGGSNLVYLYTGSASGLSPTPAVLTGPAGSAYFGTTVTSAGDVNGDGFGDIAIGAGHNTMDVYLGSASGLVSTPIVISQPLVGLGYGFAISISSAGDVNGDGYADLIASTFTEPSGGTSTADVYLGTATGLNPTPIALYGPGGAGAAPCNGFAAVGAVDVNGDGFGDVLVNGDSAVGTLSQYGVFVYLGSTGGIGTTPTATFDTILMTGMGNRTISVASAGDLNGDGYCDIAIGDDLTPTVAVYLGSASGLASVPTTTLTMTSRTGRFGGAVAGVGDVNGDGYMDLAVSGLSDTVLVYPGSARGIETAPTILTGPDGVGFGSLPAGARDVNGDTYADLLVGCSQVLSNVYVYQGGASGVGTTPVTLMPPMGATRFGLPVAQAGEMFGAGVLTAMSWPQWPWQGRFSDPG